MKKLTIFITLVLLVASCAGGGGSTGKRSTPSGFTVGGNLNGLSGSLVLQNNGAETLTIWTDGSFKFSTSHTNGTTYNISVKIQPASQTCSVVHGKGMISGANVASVTVTCSDFTYTVGGIVSGLSGTVVLQNNSADLVTITTNGSFTFFTPLADWTAYNISVKTQPASQTCSVVHGKGNIAGANTTGVMVTCSEFTYAVGGIISGLSGTVILQNHDTDFLTIVTNSSFTFPNVLADGTAYDVTVTTDPTSQTCVVTNGTGTLLGANITVVTVTCQDAIAWDASISNSDSSLMTDVGGYRIYYGTNPGLYTSFLDVGNVTRYTITDFSKAVLPGTYYISVTTYDAVTLLESPYSNEIVKTVN